MSRIRACVSCLLLSALLHNHAFAAAAVSVSQVRSAAPFGSVAIYKPSQPEPASVALLVSGEHGWNGSTDHIARALAGTGALVIGIDVRRLLTSMARAKASCQPLAVDFELLSHQIQKRLGLKEYHVPLLIGTAAGATVVYATLAQAPTGTFDGAISLGFCALQDFSGAALCAAPQLRFAPGPKGAQLFSPAPHLEDPWIVLQGEQDAICPVQAVNQFVNQTGGAALVRLPKVGHGFSTEHDWLPQLLAAYGSLAGKPETTAARVPEIEDLPVTTVRASVETDTFALLLTGDGGWAGLDRELAERLASRQISTVGLNSLRYFWHLRTPEEAARDVTRVLEHFLADWKKTRFILIGYSFGADVAPFIVNRLPPELRKRLVSVSLLGIESDADFVIRVADWIPGSDLRGRDVRPELAAIEAPVQCIYGAGESTTICPQGKRGYVTGESIGSGHHFGGDYAAIADHVLSFAQTHRAPP